MLSFPQDRPGVEASPPSSLSLLLLVEKVPAVLWTTNADLRLTSLAGAGLARMNVHSEDYVGLPLSDFLRYNDLNSPFAAHQRALRGEPSTFDFEIMGRELEAHVEPIRGPKGDILGVIGVALDNTERRVAERALRLSEQSYRSLIEEAPYGICRVTISGELLQVNRAFAEMLAYESEQELLLHNIRSDIFVEPDRYDRFLAQLQNGSPCQGFECMWKVQQGKTILVSLGGRAVRDDSGEICYLEMLAENITERKQLEEQLREGQKMHAIGQLAGGVAHDFNNLLTVVKGQVEMILLRLRDGDPLRYQLEEVAKAADRASVLTRQLLAFSRRQVLDSKVLDLNAVIAAVTQMLARLIGENIELTFVPGSELGHVNADPGQIERVLMNLVVNSRDAMPQGGQLTIETHNAQFDAAYACRHAIVKPGDYVALIVSDTGHGMDAETQSHMFEPFFTTKSPGEGTGLGLSMVYGVVKQSGGYICAYSEPGRGATFKIYLPRVNDPVTEDTRTPPAFSSGGNETILLAEDEENVRQLVASFLGSMGYRVLLASDGESARQAAHSHTGEIDLLLTDIVMPKGGGRELAEDLRKTFPYLKVLFTSGYAGDAVVRHGILESGSAFVPKPFSVQFLARKIREILDGPSIQPAGNPTDSPFTMS